MYYERTTVGLDVHARTVIAEAVDWSTGEVFSATLDACPEVIVEWVRQLPGPVLAGYEAGPTGWGLARAFAAAGIACKVLAPSKMERPPGDRVKTDRRDARRMARLLHIGEVQAVAVPSVEQEDARDLVRSREAARADLMRSRHRLSKLLLRHGIVYNDGDAWTLKHELWLRRQHFDTPGTAAAFDEAFDAVLAVTARRDRLDAAVTQMAATPYWQPIVSRLAVIRGVATLTGLGLAVEIGDWTRFTGSSIGAFVGLVPTESSSGPNRSQGSITKTGNTHARRLLVEAAWHQAKPLGRPGKDLRARRAVVSPAVRARGEAADRRLRHRWITMSERRKKSGIIVVAVARELAGWCWSLATMTD